MGVVCGNILKMGCLSYSEQFQKLMFVMLFITQQ